MKRMLYIVATILEVLLYVGAYVIHYYTRRKMGMLRYVIYKNGKWEAQMPVKSLQYAAALLLMIVLIVIVCIVKKHLSVRWAWVSVCVTGITVAVYMGYMLLCSTESMRAYYFISIMLGAAAMVQSTKTLIGVIYRCHRDN